MTRSADGVDVRLLRRGPRLLALGPARVSASGDAVSCRYLVLGGLLVRRAGGELVLSQTGRGEVELRSALAGFFPALGRGPGRAGPLYSHVQSRIHAAAARRFFRSLAQEPGV